ncbi:hypothetical protein N658DRAFT_125845 [Parathielavia hyrcaniae]|uniref:Uncharacterized protein n=1 Tax=Parathielavia hyrcaniae TaxID=113614 RepID=A0AAN6Q8I5_9PEZI|nr:hypothetical protein N658DRAFT_125845 [Parathielavia hyrcaniae]
MRHVKGRGGEGGESRVIRPIIGSSWPSLRRMRVAAGCWLLEGCSLAPRSVLWSEFLPLILSFTHSFTVRYHQIAKRSTSVLAPACAARICFSPGDDAYLLHSIWFSKLPSQGVAGLRTAAAIKHSSTDTASVSWLGRMPEIAQTRETRSTPGAPPFFPFHHADETNIVC